MSDTNGRDIPPEGTGSCLLEWLRMALCAVAEPILIIDSRAPRILEANPRVCELAGCSLAEIRRADAPNLLQRIGLSDLLPPGMRLPPAKGVPREIFWYDAATDDSICWRILPPNPSDAAIVTVVGYPVEAVSHSPSARLHANPFASLRIDPLTGLPDRTAFEESLDAKCVRTSGLDEMPFAVLFIDLDGFKGVNDRLGHRYGDRVLRDIAQRLRQALRPGDLVARFGGDEFTVLLDAVHSAHDTIGIAERLLAMTASASQGTPDAESVSISIGIALGHAGMSPPNLIDAADRAMYRAKAVGGATWALAEEETR